MKQEYVIKHTRKPGKPFAKITVRVPPEMRDQAVDLNLNISAIARYAIGKAIRSETYRIQQEKRKTARAATLARILQDQEKGKDDDLSLRDSADHTYGRETADNHAEVENAPGKAPDREVATQ